MKAIYLHAMAYWGLLALLMILNGIARGIYGSGMKDLHAHWISTVTGVAIIAIVTYLFLSRTDLEYSAGDLWLIGVMWVVSTVAFEFLFGHFVAGHDWSRLLQDYNLLEGRVWTLMLASTLVMPYVAGTYLVVAPGGDGGRSAMEAGGPAEAADVR